MQQTNEIIINFAPTGMIPTKEMTPHVPITANEIIEQVHKAHELGITSVHLHARDELTGAPTYKASVFEKIISGIRHHCPDLVICTSLSGRNWNEFSKRTDVLQLKPDMGSLTLGSLNFTNQASVNSPEMIQKLAIAMKEKGVKPELEVFNLGMINYAHYLIKKDLITPPYYFNIIVGNVAGVQTKMAQIGTLLSELPENSFWSLGGIGNNQLIANALSIASGGGVRFGLEDNIYFDKNRKTLATNIDLLKRIHQLADLLERPIMPTKKFGELGFYNFKYRGCKENDTLQSVGAF